MLCHTEQMKVNFVKNNNTLTSLHDSLISVWHSFSYLSFKSFFFFNVTCRLLLLPSADLQKKKNLGTIRHSLGLSDMWQCAVEGYSLLDQMTSRNLSTYSVEYVNVL